MGLLINVYRNPHGDCTNNGVSSRSNFLLLVNAEGPFEPKDHPNIPQVEMQTSVPGYLRLIPKTIVSNHYMVGGNFGYTSDPRFAQLAEKLLGHPFYGAVAIHDRVE